MARESTFEASEESRRSRAKHSNPCRSERILPSEGGQTEENRHMMKRTKSLVSSSTEHMSPGEMKSLAVESAIQKNEREPYSKRRVMEEPNLTVELEFSGFKADDSCFSKRTASSTESSADDLPDPSIETSPDEYLLLLTKAELGVDFEIRPALSLNSFFVEVSEEQMAAYNTEVVGSVRNNDLELLKKLHGKGQALDCFNRFGESLLNIACRRGFESIARYLLDTAAVDVKIRDDCGRTPLHDACWNPSPQLAICQSIIEREPALLFVADRRGCTAFQYARKEHWDQWRKFLFANRKSLLKLKEPETLSRFTKC